MRSESLRHLSGQVAACGRRHASLLILMGAFLLLCAHASRFEFIADDAYITLRYADHLAHHGAPVYNLGERVEGYTSPLWMLLTAGGIWAGFDPEGFVQVAGLCAGLLLLTSSFALWRTFEPRAREGGALLLAALAASAPIAAWTSGGLETALFTALTTMALAWVARAATSENLSDALVLSLLLTLAAFTRPEGMLVSFCLGLTVSVYWVRQSRRVWQWFGLFLPFLLGVGGHVLWRLSYYGYPLPNTFYVKCGGAGGSWQRGVSYLFFAAHEMGWSLVAGVTLMLFLPARIFHPVKPETTQVADASIVWATRLLFFTYLPYIMVIGGDFLDLYRFLVPLLPAWFAVTIARSYQFLSRAKTHSVVMAAIALAALAWHSERQYELGTRALRISEPARAERGLEPLGWTKHYSRCWAAVGRWIRARAGENDSMAVGAAGAIPFFAQIPNLDLYGLNDPVIAHYGRRIGNRPGHQRFATEAYIRQRQPTFLLLDAESLRPTPAAMSRVADQWEPDGYILAEMHVTREVERAPVGFYQFVLLKRERAQALAHTSGFRVVESEP